jgi:hypothetical protein
LNFRELRKDLFNRIHGFYDIKIVASALDLNLFLGLKDGTTVAAAAKRAEVHERGVEALLIGLQALGLAEFGEGEYKITEFGTAMLDPASPDFVGGIVRFAEWQADALPKLSSTLKTDRPCWEGFGHYVEGAQLAADTTENQDKFNAALDSGARSTAKAVCEMHDFSGYKSLLDVGGNLGGFSSILLDRNPALRATVFDLPQVAAQLKRHSPHERLSAIGGDFTADEFPRGHDLITFIRIFNSRSRELCLDLLKKGYAALEPGGTCLFYEEHVLDDDQKNVSPAMLWGVMFILISSGARVQHLRFWKELYTEAGFVDVVGQTKKHYGVVSGRKP